jgi:pilus assembly protein TadC
LLYKMLFGVFSHSCSAIQSRLGSAIWLSGTFSLMVSK